MFHALHHQYSLLQMWQAWDISLLPRMLRLALKHKLQALAWHDLVALCLAMGHHL